MTAFNEPYLVYVTFLRLTLSTFVSEMALNAGEFEHAVGEKVVCSPVAFPLKDIEPSTIADDTPIA